MIDLSAKIGSLKLKNPVLVASGCFGVGREYAEIFDLNLLGGIVTKTVTPKPREGNPPPRLWETPSGMLNSIGLANPGLDIFIDEEIPFLDGLDTAVIVSIAGDEPADFAALAEKLDSIPAVDALELNVSCPNVKKGGLAFGTDEKALREVVELARKATDKPLWVKLTPNVTDITAMGKVAAAAGADAICAINTLPGMDIDIRSRRPRIGNIFGGLSGPAIRPVALAKVFKLHRGLPDIPVIGIGGISDPEDAVAHLLAGASAVQVGSGIFREPHLPIQCIQFMAEYCESAGYESTADIRGAVITSDEN